MPITSLHVLEPVEGYTSSSPLAMSDAGHELVASDGTSPPPFVPTRTVGMSFTPDTPGWPAWRATLWVHDEPIALTDAPQMSQGFLVNNRRDVVYAVWHGPALSAPEYFLWRDGTSTALAPLVRRPGHPRGLNDDGQVVIEGDDGGDIVLDIDSETRTALPPLPADRRIVGIDNQGRVLALEWVSGPSHVRWLPPGGTSWRDTGLVQLDGWAPALSRDGTVLVSTPDYQGSAIGMALDLDDASAPAVALPPLRTNGADYVSIPTYAAKDLIVGFELHSKALVYDRATGNIEQLDGGAIQLRQARAVNVQGHIACHAARYAGTPAVQRRAVLLNVDQPDGAHLQRIPDLVLSILAGIGTGGGGVGIRPGGGVVPIDPPRRIRPARMDAMRALAIGELARTIDDPHTRRALERTELRTLVRVALALRTDARRNGT